MAITPLNWENKMILREGWSIYGREQQNYANPVHSRNFWGTTGSCLLFVLIKVHGSNFCFQPVSKIDANYWHTNLANYKVDHNFIRINLFQQGQAGPWSTTWIGCPSFTPYLPNEQVPVSSTYLATQISEITYVGIYLWSNGPFFSVFDAWIRQLLKLTTCLFMLDLFSGHDPLL